MLSEEIKEDIRFLKKHDCEFNCVKDKLNYYLPKVEQLEKENEEMLNELKNQCKHYNYDISFERCKQIKTTLEKLGYKWEEICK